MILEGIWATWCTRLSPCRPHRLRSVSPNRPLRSCTDAFCLVEQVQLPPPLLVHPPTGPRLSAGCTLTRSMRRIPRLKCVETMPWKFPLTRICTRPSAHCTSHTHILSIASSHTFWVTVSDLNRRPTTLPPAAPTQILMCARVVWFRFQRANSGRSDRVGPPSPLSPSCHHRTDWSK